MKICLVGELTGGVGVYGRNLLEGLLKLGLEPSVITSAPENSPGARAIPVKRYTGRGRWLPQARAFTQALKQARHEFDLIHFTDARFSVFLPRGEQAVVGTMNDYFYAITSWMKGTGSANIYSDWPLRHLYYNFTRMMERPALRRLDRILCISESVSEVLTDRYSIPAEKLSVIPYGINYGKATGEKISYPGEMILFAGGNFQRKGLGTLIQAAPRILQDFPGVRFVILGQSGDASLMKALCENRGVAAAFEFVGQVDYETLYKYYRGASIFTMPSLLEAFGIPFLEAMHCGIPVVASRVRGPDFYLQDGTNSLMAKTGEPEDLARCILEILKNKKLRGALVKNGKQTAREFKVETMARRTLAAYQAALDSRGAKAAGS